MKFYIQSQLIWFPYIIYLRCSLSVMWRWRCWGNLLQL